jgi:hypothetical protein
MTGHRIPIPRGWRIDRHGKLVRSTKHLDVSRRLQKQASRKVRVARKGQTR